MLQNLFGSWLAGVAKNDKAYIQVGGVLYFGPFEM
jgi:hypothetical protein